MRFTAVIHSFSYDLCLELACLRLLVADGGYKQCCPIRGGKKREKYSL